MRDNNDFLTSVRFHGTSRMVGGDLGGFSILYVERDSYKASDLSADEESKTSLDFGPISTVASTREMTINMV